MAGDRPRGPGPGSIDDTGEGRAILDGQAPRAESGTEGSDGSQGTGRSRSAPRFGGWTWPRRSPRASGRRPNRAFAENVVLCFRGQKIERPEQFPRRRHEPGRTHAAGHRHLPPAGVRRDRGADEQGDRPAYRGPRAAQARRLMAYRPRRTSNVRPRATVLPCHRGGAERGGNTEFTQPLPGLRGAGGRGQGSGPGTPGLSRLSLAPRAEKAPHQHARRRRRRQLRMLATARPPPSGDRPQRALYLNPMRCDAVEGMGREDGDALLESPLRALRSTVLPV